jgi:2-methylisocitrate lyase-like PEP mutase family enzyme
MKQKMHGDVFQQMKAMDQKYDDMSHKKHTAKDHAKMTKNRQNFKQMNVQELMAYDDEFDDIDPMEDD